MQSRFIFHVDLFGKVKVVQKNIACFQETNVMCRYMPERNTLSNLWSLLVNDREKMFPFPNENKPHKKRLTNWRSAFEMSNWQKGLNGFWLLLCQLTVTHQLSCVHCTWSPHPHCPIVPGRYRQPPVVSFTPAPATSCTHTDTAQSNTPLHLRSTIHCIFRHYD